MCCETWNLLLTNLLTPRYCHKHGGAAESVGLKIIDHVAGAGIVCDWKSDCVKMMWKCITRKWWTWRNWLEIDDRIRVFRVTLVVSTLKHWCATPALVITHFQSWLHAYGTVCRLASPRRCHRLLSVGVSDQNFSCNVLARTVWQFCSALLILCIMLDSKDVLLIVKCSCSPRILWHFNHIRA